MNESGPFPAEPQLDGITVLVVEDETIVAFLIEDMLTELGCSAVWLANGVNDALSILHDRTPDIAVLDINLAGQQAYPIAEQLEARQIPFVFATGYGRDGIDERWAVRPVIQKPFQLDMLARTLTSVLNR